MRHRWTEPSKFVPFADYGVAWNVRTCVQCGMQKFTMLPPQGWPWHEFQPVNGARLVQERTPPCEAVEEEAA